jgi:hypothetical protein
VLHSDRRLVAIGRAKSFSAIRAMAQSPARLLIALIVSEVRFLHVSLGNVLGSSLALLTIARPKTEGGS